MSTKAKGIKIDQIIEQFKKSDIDDQIVCLKRLTVVVKENLEKDKADLKSKVSQRETELENLNGNS